MLMWRWVTGGISYTWNDGRRVLEIWEDEDEEVYALLPAFDNTTEKLTDDEIRKLALLIGTKEQVPAEAGRLRLLL